jgi:hypothetical protein
MNAAGYFGYTQASYWGGPSHAYWMLIVATVFLGFFGLDHFFLRSPTTGILKLVINIFGLGLWWIYDMIQIVGDEESVRKHGLTAPLVGPLGVGAGAFLEAGQERDPSVKSPFRWLLYVLTLFLPVTFGLDMLAAGDFQGAIMKFLATVIPLLWPFLMLWGVVSVGRGLFMPKTLFEEGVDRVFPFSWIAGAKGSSVLGPKDIVAEGGSTLTGLLMPWIERFVPAVAAAGTAGVAVSKAVEAGATAAKVAANTVTKASEALQGTVIPAAAAIGQMAKQVPNAVAGAGALSGKVLESLPTSPQAIQQMVIQQAMKPMVGGGLIGGSESSIVSNVIFIGLAVLMLIGSFQILRRRNPNFGFGGTKKEDDGRQRNDTPPQPSRF